MKTTRLDLGGGIFLTAIQTEKFKSATLSATFLTPLRQETAARNALIPYVLRRGCEGCPTMEQVSAALDELYGGLLEPAVRKRGETQCLGLVGSFLDDPYALEGEPVLAPACGLLTRLLLHPVTREGVFQAGYVDGERDNLVKAIRGEKNDKRAYALAQLTRAMCQDEPYGVDRLGSEAAAAALTPREVWAGYRDLLAHAPLELHYCGSAAPERVAELLSGLAEELRPLRGEHVPLDCQVVARPAGDAPRQAEDRLEVTQGKLALGFRTGGVRLGSEDYPALLVFNALYGGGSNSKLFVNVREKRSLCYYAGSALESVKGILVVSSGVEFDRMDEALEEIAAQLKAVQAGDFTPEELEAARESMVSVYESALDSRAQLEQFWLTAAVTGVDAPPEEMAARLGRVRAQDVIRVARGVELDTVYRLLGREERRDG